MKKIVIANWKLNLTNSESTELSRELVDRFDGGGEADVVVCPDFVSLKEVASIVSGGGIGIGAQDVFWENKGAYTGEVSVDILKEVGCKYVIIGHSERRQYIGENFDMIHRKVNKVIDVGGIVPIVCIGETLDERKRNVQDYVLSTQLEMALGGVKFVGFEEVIVAYEPMWAIGTGEVIEVEDVVYMHKIIKLIVKDMFGMGIADNNFRYVYGGSVNADNVGQFKNLANVDGLLVGGASAKVESFLQIVNRFVVTT